MIDLIFGILILSWLAGIFLFLLSWPDRNSRRFLRAFAFADFGMMVMSLVALAEMLMLMTRL